ncbi:hypothetical protein [Methylopila sp. 73B]|uniref:hypothetical protein n=1 Tax=Methylopila sp. 73B TaxID=1120792 RepID=UPI0003706782|nr:hypothetical protein [Methylopila sp. 73B]
MAEPSDLIIPMLQQIRTSIEALDGKIDHRFDRAEERLKALEAQHRSSEHAQTAETLFGKLVTGDFEEQIEALERKVRELESSK